MLFDTRKVRAQTRSDERASRTGWDSAEVSDAPVVIEGHTDGVGSVQANQVLSENRASAVRQWLAGNGIAASRLSTKGFGATVPVAPNDTPEGRQQNRSVEIRVQN